MRTARGKKINPVSVPVFGIIMKPKAAFSVAAPKRTCRAVRRSPSLIAAVGTRNACTRTRAHTCLYGRHAGMAEPALRHPGPSGAAPAQRCYWDVWLDPTAPTTFAIKQREVENSPPVTNTHFVLESPNHPGFKGCLRTPRLSFCAN